jgi:hypothetical protein
LHLAQAFSCFLCLSKEEEQAEKNYPEPKSLWVTIIMRICKASQEARERSLGGRVRVCGVNQYSNHNFNQEFTSLEEEFLTQNSRIPPAGGEDGKHLPAKRANSLLRSSSIGVVLSGYPY